MSTNIILFDSDNREHLLPLTFTRPTGEIRVGILKIKEKWEKWLNGKASYITQDYLSEKFPIHIEEDNIIINGSALPSPYLVRLIKELGNNEALLQDGELIAGRLDSKQFDNLMKDREIEELKGFELTDTPFIQINTPWDIFKFNKEALIEDFELLTKGRKSQSLSTTNRVINHGNIFLEEGANVEFSILNAKDAPIYIGANATIMEGAMIRGGLALCDNAIVKMGAKLYGANTIGPHCKIGGEVSNSIFMGYSNKGHEGYIGNSVIGEWCNFGADSNTSNLKNDYGEVKLWNYPAGRFLSSGEQFLGLIMGDHSKCGINTMFNTGTVVGVFCNIFGAGYPRNFIPSFSWGGKQGFSTYQLVKTSKVAKKVMARRNIEFSKADENILKIVADATSEYRTWDKQKTS